VYTFVHHSRATVGNFSLREGLARAAARKSDTQQHTIGTRGCRDAWRRPSPGIACILVCGFGVHAYIFAYAFVPARVKSSIGTRIVTSSAERPRSSMLVSTGALTTHRRLIAYICAEHACPVDGRSVETNCPFWSVCLCVCVPLCSRRVRSTRPVRCAGGSRGR
jgi:hypothetical protein